MRLCCRTDSVHAARITGGEAAGLLQPVDAASGDVPAAVGLAVEAFVAAARLVGAPGNHSADAALAQPAPDRREAVSLVADEAARAAAEPSGGAADAHRVHHRLEPRRLVRLACRHLGREGNGSTVSDQVDLASPAASRATQRVVGRLLRDLLDPAPAAERLARTLDPSTHHSSPSMRPSASSRSCGRSRMRSNMPLWRQRLNRSSTLCHVP